MYNPMLDTAAFKDTRELRDAAGNVIGYKRRTVTEPMPFVMYRTFTNAQGECELIEVARGTCTGIEDLGKELEAPEPRKFENWATFQLSLPA